MGRGGYRSRVVTEVRCIFSQCLKVSNVSRLQSLIAVGNSLQMVGEALYLHVPNAAISLMYTGSSQRSISESSNEK